MTIISTLSIYFRLSDLAIQHIPFEYVLYYDQS